MKLKCSTSKICIFLKKIYFSSGQQMWIQTCFLPNLLSHASVFSSFLSFFVWRKEIVLKKAGLSKSTGYCFVLEIAKHSKLTMGQILYWFFWDNFWIWVVEGENLAIKQNTQNTFLSPSVHPIAGCHWPFTWQGNVVTPDILQDYTNSNSLSSSLRTQVSSQYLILLSGTQGRNFADYDQFWLTLNSLNWLLTCLKYLLQSLCSLLWDALIEIKLSNAVNW